MESIPLVKLSLVAHQNYIENRWKIASVLCYYGTMLWHSIWFVLLSGLRSGTGLKYTREIKLIFKFGWLLQHNDHLWKDILKTQNKCTRDILRVKFDVKKKESELVRDWLRIASLLEQIEIDESNGVREGGAAIR